MELLSIKITVLVSLVLSLMMCVSSGFSGYSYAKFRGPVSGPEHEVVYDDGKYHHHQHHHHHKPVVHDYVAKPDYHFAYGVVDPKSMVKQSRHETRYGDEVKGEYSVLDPDGKYRTVKYTADKHNGFQAEIITDGNLHTSTHYPMPPVEHTPQSHAHEVHHHEEPHHHHHQHKEHTPHHHHHHQHEEHTPHDMYHPHSPQGHAHEVHHHEEDANSYNEEESSEGGGAYEESEDTSDSESGSEESDDGNEYF